MANRRKSTSPPPATAAPGPEAVRSRTGLIVSSVVVLALAIGVVAYLRGTRAESSAGAESTAPPAAALAPPPAQAVIPPPAVPPKPHTTQKVYPQLHLPGYPLGRPPEVISAAYRFAAEHPEILTYVPCYCGCERMGHHGNEDCFVKARAANGDVTEWEDHGMECNVCIDVATQSMQMYASGASVRDIRAAVEAKWTPRLHSHTPTPDAPK